MRQIGGGHCPYWFEPCIGSVLFHTSYIYWPSLPTPLLMSSDPQSKASAGRTEIVFTTCTVKQDILSVCLSPHPSLPTHSVLSTVCVWCVFFMIHVVLSVQPLSLFPPPPLSSLSPSLLPARPLQACCREGLRDVTEGWSGSLLVGADKKNGEKIARWVWDAHFFHFLKTPLFRSHWRRCVCVYACHFVNAAATHLCIVGSPVQRWGASAAGGEKNRRKNVSVPGCHPVLRGGHSCCHQHRCELTCVGALESFVRRVSL